ncbi:MAG: hypothetical protein JWR51_3854 [Devosia sp.]|uniref:hypothetical protein n=1 Tax=Devosia sp. TaxID=1871048 RepID=UPI002630CADB|nr:hypothetical protein [Devosia sp.]MDB5530751.1 hypothetical protein [Devosia sp.]
MGWSEIDPTGERAQALFPENAQALETDMGRPHHVYIADIDYPAGPLTFAMWVGPGVCGMANCGLKIFDDSGLHLGGAEVCDRPDAVKIDLAGQFVRLCSDRAQAVADLFWNYSPPTATNTAGQWQSREIQYLYNNGSRMAVSPDEGTIRYDRVRDGLRGLIADGTVLFRGEPWQPGGAFRGVAYTFRKGCDPASYQVVAGYEGFAELLTLRGEAPVRVEGGCEISRYTVDSGNAILTFDPTFD